jgi:hypothetical protein
MSLDSIARYKIFPVKMDVFVYEVENFDILFSILDILVFSPKHRDQTIHTYRSLIKRHFIFLQKFLTYSHL